MVEKKTDRCLKILDLLPRFIENDFSAEESADIAAHLAACESCRREYDAMSRLIEALEAMPTVGVPPSFKDAVMELLPEKDDPETG